MLIYFNVLAIKEEDNIEIISINFTNLGSRFDMSTDDFGVINTVIFEQQLEDKVDGCYELYGTLELNFHISYGQEGNEYDSSLDIVDITVEMVLSKHKHEFAYFINENVDEPELPDNLFKEDKTIIFH